RPEGAEDFVAQQDAGGAAKIDRLVGLAVESLLAEWVANRDVDEVLLHGKAEVPRWLVDQPEQRLENRVRPYRLGIEIAAATVVYLAPPDDVKDAFDRVTEAQTEIRTQVNTADSEARKLVRQKESEKFNITQLAQAYAQEQRLQAAAEAQS